MKPDVEFGSCYAFETKKMPPQGIYEEYTFYTYLQGNRIPKSYNLKSVGSSVSFAMPCSVNSRIQGLSVCVIYTLSNTCDAPYDWDYDECLHKRISNATKHLKWSYCPRFFGIPRADEDMMWLSYWKFEDQLLEGGDEMNISIVASEAFQVKEVGVRLVYKEAEEKKNTISGESGSSSSSSLEQIQYPHSYSYGKTLPPCCSFDCDKCNGTAFLACCTGECDHCKASPYPCCSNGDCALCQLWELKNDHPLPGLANPLRVIPLGYHPEDCKNCPSGYKIWHHDIRNVRRRMKTSPTLKMLRARQAGS